MEGDPTNFHTPSPADREVGTQTRTPVGTPATGTSAGHDELRVSVSTTFHPHARISNFRPDLILLSTDKVFFHVHRQPLLGASTNEFNGLLHAVPPPRPDAAIPVVSTPEPAEVANILLHAIYGIPCTHFGSSLETTARALYAFATYGLPVHPYATPPQPLYALVLSYAPTHPIDAYALAAAHDLEPLATAISSHLLAFPLSSLTDELATAIGPRYLLRLFFLHQGRMDALKRVLLQPPRSHEPSWTCGAEELGKLTRAWALAATQLAWDARPSLSTHAIQLALRPLESQINCEVCLQLLRDRVQEVINEWSAVKRTI
ncbi:hypothetical protein CERSUDRAFT_144185 [Gelatoporia subvermispora B]|uniref:BTB domain-containing protein n=1 Tax=Ceriporiopsis subvermispora (strain B) TaxID=914234 RepID=M2Q5G8_CERS8|nr:hypothetical protein CERSUDRAFT_144185 [Gelatoporia subvermispora B]